MAGERVKLQVQARESRGSAASRRLREEGLIPGVLYGSGDKAHPFCIEERELRKALTGDHGLHAILDVILEGQQKAHHAVVKDYQLDPTRARLLHIDLHEVRLDQSIQTSVVVELVGEAAGQKEGGVLSQINREVRVEALPMEVPDHLELDISAMVIGDSLRITDLRVPEGVTLLDDPETVLATVSPPTKEPEPEEVEAEEGEEIEGEAVEGEGEAAEGEAGAEGGESEAEASGEDKRRGLVRAPLPSGRAGLDARPLWSSGSAIPAASTRRRGTTSVSWSRTSSPGGTAARGARSSPARSRTCASTVRGSRS